VNFRKVDQRGGTNYPSADSGWAEEISLDPDIKVDTMKINAPKPKPIVEHVPVSVPVAAGCPAGTYDGGSRCIPVPHARSAADLANDPWIEDQIAAQSGIRDRSQAQTPQATAMA
jgi:hypothetical protein